MQPPLYAAIKVAIDVDLFGKWKTSGKKSQTSLQLASVSGVDPELLGMDDLLSHAVRYNQPDGQLGAILPFFVSMHILEESGPNAFSQTPFSLSLTEREMQGFFRWL